MTTSQQGSSRICLLKQEDVGAAAGRWEARIGIPGSRHIYLGLFNNEEMAARNYDKSLVRLRGPGAATNFGLADYRTDLADYHKMQQVLAPLCEHISRAHTG